MVSVIIPVYNTEKYLEKCIASVAAQTEKDFEIIIIDDGSTDGSLELARSLQNQFRQCTFKIIHQENRGLASARNRGIEVAAGEYLTFLDSDDFIHPQFLEILLRALKDGKAQMSFCKYCKVEESAANRIFEEGSYKRAEINVMNMAIYRERQVFDLLFDNNDYAVISCAKLISRKVFNRLRFEKGRTHEDEFMIHHMLGECDRVSFIDEELYFYLQHGGSITRSNRSLRQIRDVVEAYKDRLEYFEQKKLDKEYDGSLLQLVGFVYSMQEKGDSEAQGYLRGILKEYWSIVRERKLYSFLSVCKYWVRMKM